MCKKIYKNKRIDVNKEEKISKNQNSGNNNKNFLYLNFK